VITGSLLFVVAVGSAVIGRPWVECALIALGAWLVASSWVLDFELVAARSTFVCLGSVALGLGLWSLVDVLRANERPAN
ncbi:MAG: hypothetical protein ABJD97_04515, partial [Betaproteobacteria bacterium]